MKRQNADCVGIPYRGVFTLASWSTCLYKCAIGGSCTIWQGNLHCNPSLKNVYILLKCLFVVGVLPRWRLINQSNACFGRKKSMKPTAWHLELGTNGIVNMRLQWQKMTNPAFRIWGSMEAYYGPLYPEVTIDTFNFNARTRPMCSLRRQTLKVNFLYSIVSIFVIVSFGA